MIRADLPGIARKVRVLDGSGNGELVVPIASHRPSRLTLPDHELPQTERPEAETRPRRPQPEPPSAPELLVQQLLDLLAVLQVSLRPFFERPCVVLAQVFVVLLSQTRTLECTHDLAEGRQVPAWKDVLVDERTDRSLRFLRDRVQHENPARYEQVGHGPKEQLVVLGADMLEHADGNDPIELRTPQLCRQLLVVERFELHQMLDTFASGQQTCMRELLPADRNARHPDTVLLGCGYGQVARATAHVQQAQPLQSLQLQLIV